MNFFRFFISSIILLHVHTTYAQEYVFSAQKINIENGLPNRSIYDITQDADGYIWVSSAGSISKYDGHQFITYPSSFLKIRDNLATLIASDYNNNIWYCERNTLKSEMFSGVLNTEKDTIYNFKEFSNGLFTSRDVDRIDQSNKNPSDIFITTRKGIIYKYSDHFEEIYRFPNKLEHKAFVQEAKGQGYWILYGENILKIENSKRISSYSIPKDSSRLHRIISQTPKLIVEARKDQDTKTYWQLMSDRLVPYKFPNKDQNPDQIFQVEKDFVTHSNNDTIYVSNHSGDKLFEFNNVSNAGADFKYSTVLVDKQNILWIASGNGLYKVVKKKNPFKIQQIDQSIRGIFKDGDNLYVGSYTENVHINLKSNKKTGFVDTQFIAVSTLLKDKNSHIWAGTTGSFLYEFVPKTKDWRFYDAKNDGSLYVPYINPKTGRLWLGTSNGLAYLDASTKEIEYVDLPIMAENTEIKHFHQNDQGLWIVSNNGLFLMDAQTELILEHYNNANGLPYTNLNHLFEDTDGTFWLASKGGGLIRWDLDANIFTSYTIQNGLSNNTIYAVYADDYNNLWLPSNYGLMCFNKATKNVNLYLTKDGIAHEEFNTFSHFKDTNGTLYFGGLNGVTLFHPKDLIEDNSTEVPINLNQIQVLNEYNSNFEDITERYRSNRKIVLEPTDRVLEIDVSLMDFEDANEIQYMYQIQGYHERWIYTKNNKISFNNLPYGNYTLYIKGRGLASNNFSKTIEVPIVVKKPFYLTWPFILFTALLLISLLLFYVKWRVSKLEKDRSRLESEVKVRTREIENDKRIIEEQAEKLKKLDEAKSRFFTNITHEFRTPLTLIKGPLEQVIENPPPPNIFKRRMQGVLKNTNHFLELINQLLDLSKLEGGEMKLEVVYTDIVSHTKDLVNRFQYLAQKKEQQLSCVCSDQHWVTYYDQGKWDKIIFNLISNAIKFTPKFGSIQVSLRSVQLNNIEHIVLRVKDSGVGISKTQQKFIFNRFYQIDNSLSRHYEGTGIGLALVRELVTMQNGTISLESEKDKGTLFEIHLPILKNEKLVEKTYEFIDSEHQLIPNPVDTVSNPELLNINNTGRLELLIVEDNEDMREYIIQCLNSSLYNINEASNGEEGLQKAQSIIPDLIISDVMMPKLDGFEFTKGVRNSITTSHIPIILLTAKANDESKLEGLTRGADVYITKPFSPKELEIRVQKLIEIRTLIQKRYENGLATHSSEIFQQEDVFIIELRRFIVEHLDESELNGDQIGVHFAISRVHLYRKLKALTNLSVSEYVKKVRLEIALQLIKEGQLNVSEIAYKTGFSSPGHFSKTFKKAYGKTPSQM